MLNADAGGHRAASKLGFPPTHPLNTTFLVRRNGYFRRQGTDVTDTRPLQFRPISCPDSWKRFPSLHNHPRAAGCVVILPLAASTATVGAKGTKEGTKQSRCVHSVEVEPPTPLPFWLASCLSSLFVGEAKHGKLRQPYSAYTQPWSGMIEDEPEEKRKPRGKKRKETHDMGSLAWGVVLSLSAGRFSRNHVTIHCRTPRPKPNV